MLLCVFVVFTVVDRVSINVRDVIAGLTRRGELHMVAVLQGQAGSASKKYEPSRKDDSNYVDKLGREESGLKHCRAPWLTRELRR